MLLDGGTLDGKRVLRPQTVAAMTSNQLTGPSYPVRFGIPFPGTGFGLGVSVVVESRRPDNPVGEYGWAGAATTHFSISPDHELTILVLTQLMPFSTVPEDRIAPLVYAAIQER